MSANASNLDLVRTAFAAFERRDLAGLQAQCTTDVRFVSQTARVGGAGQDYIGHKGLAWFEVETKGVTAHGSMPEVGDNAIVKMAHVIGDLEHCQGDRFGKATMGDLVRPARGAYGCQR